MRTDIIAVAIVALIIGVAIGYFAAPPRGVEVTTTTVTAPGVATTTTVKETVTTTTTVEKPTPPLAGEIPIGAALPLTGELATFGENEKVALEIATDEINDFLKASGIPVTIKLLVEDTATKPDIALEKLKVLAAKGVKVVLGMMSSAEVRNVKGYADANKILIVSPSSTAPALAIPGDYVFRLCPDDTKQGPAIARVIYDSGVQYVIPVWRGDAWGDGLVDAAKKRFEEIGGTVLEGVRYAPEAKEFSAEVSVLASKVEDAISKYGKDKVGIYYVAFEEAATLLSQAAEYPVLSEVKWFGSDGTALSAAIVEEATAAEFSTKTEFVNPIFAPAKSDKYLRLKKAIEEKLGRTPDSYTYNVYDGLWLIVKSMLIAGKYDADAIRKVLPTVADTTFGASGWVKLNEAGDRELGDYELWAILKEDGKYVWKLVGLYSAASDSVTWL